MSLSFCWPTWSCWPFTSQKASPWLLKMWMFQQSLNLLWWWTVRTVPINQWQTQCEDHLNYWISWTRPNTRQVWDLQSKISCPVVEEKLWNSFLICSFQGQRPRSSSRQSSRSDFTSAIEEAMLCKAIVTLRALYWLYVELTRKLRCKATVFEWLPHSFLSSYLHKGSTPV